MVIVWQDTGDGKIVYIPTEDGAFEAWMDEHDPSWKHSNSSSIEFWREIWEAACEWTAVRV